MSLNWTEFPSNLFLTLVTLLVLSACHPHPNGLNYHRDCNSDYQLDARHIHASQSRQRIAIAPFVWRELMRAFGREAARQLIWIGGACLERAIQSVMTYCDGPYYWFDFDYHRAPRFPNGRTYRYVARR